MCVIFACEKEFPKWETLKDGEMMNSDGAGIAWLDKKKRVHFKKGLDAKKIWNMIKSNTVELPCIIHFRIGSVGTSSKELTHPFIISIESPLDLDGILPKSSNGVLFHNGTIPDWKKLLKENIMLSQTKMLKGEISDSRVMAYVSALYGHEFIELISEGWNKYAILDKDGIHKYGSWGKVDNSVEGSNDYYKSDFKGMMYSNPDDMKDENEDGFYDGYGYFGDD